MPNENAAIESFTEVHAMRRLIDKYMEGTKHLMPSREISLCHTNLQRSFHFLGLALKELGGRTPYVNSENPQNAIIEHQSDKRNEDIPMSLWDNCVTQLERVKYIRSQLSMLIKVFVFVQSEVTTNCVIPSEGYFANQHVGNSKLAMEEAKCWLGWELARIKKIQDGAQEDTAKVNIPLY